MAGIAKREAITVKQEYKRFEQAVTFVLLPYFHRNQFVGGVLLTSPIKGSREIISQMNSYLIYTTFIALAIALLLSGLLSTVPRPAHQSAAVSNRKCGARRLFRTDPDSRCR